MDRGFDVVLVDLSGAVVFVRISELEVGDREVPFSVSEEEIESVVEAEVAFFFNGTLLDTRETGTLAVWVVALEDV